VDGERTLEFLGLRGFRHLRQNFEDGVLGEIRVLELMQKEGLQILVSHSQSPDPVAQR
jgi:hypothetical protein